MVTKHLHTLFAVGTGGHLTDGELLERFIAERDPAAFEILFERHGPMVLRVCRSRLDDLHGVEDAFQATFLILVQRARTIQLRGSVASWLFGVANRVANRARVDAARRRKHEQNVAKPEVGAPEREEDSDAWPMLRDEVARLPLKYREPMLLCYVEGKTCAEAATRLGRPVGTIKAQLARARKRLKARLSSREGSAGIAAVGLLDVAAPAVPPLLASATLRVVMAFSLGQPESLALASTAARLARGGMRSMVLGKIKTLSVALLVVASFLGAVAFTATRPRPPGSTGQDSVDHIKVRGAAGKATEDLYGDVLPNGAIARLGSIRYRAQDTVAGLAFVGGELVVVSDQGKINYYDATSGRLLRSAAAALQNVRGFALTADRKRMAITGSSFDQALAGTVNRLKVLDAATGQAQVSIELPQGSSESFALGPDGTVAATLDTDHWVRIWDLATGKKIQSSRFSTAGLGAVGVKFSPDSSLLAVGDNSSVSLWRWKRNQPVEKVRFGGGLDYTGVTVMAFSPDGSRLVLDGGRGAGVVVIDVAKRRVVGGLGIARDAGRSASAFAFSPDGRRLVVGEHALYSEDVSVWDFSTRKRINTLSAPFGGATELTFSPDGRTLAAGSDWNGTIDIWELASGKRLTSVRPSHEAGPSFIEFTDDDSQVVTAGDDGTIRYWEVRTGKALRISELHVPGETSSSHSVRGFAVSPDERRVASSSLDNTVRVWDARTSQEIYRFPGHESLGSSFGGHRALAFSRDGRRLVSCGDDRQVIVWDIESGKPVAEYRVNPGDPPAARDQKGAERRTTLGLGRSRLSLDGTRLVMDLGSTYLFDVQTGKELQRIEWGRGSLIAYAISPDNTLFLTTASGPNEAIELAGRRLRSEKRNNDFLTLRRMSDGTLLKQVGLAERGAGPVAFSADGARFAAGVMGDNPMVRLFDTATGEERGTISGLGSEPSSVAFSRNGKLLATALKNGTVLIWDLAQAVVATAKSRAPSR